MSGHSFVISGEIRKALANEQPLVALETALVSFGLPYSQNLQIVRDMSSTIRKQRAVPALVGIVQGKVKVGLSERELRSFATRNDIVKTTISNLEVVSACSQWGAATVSATAWIAQLTRIKVLATGGIGGIHRSLTGHIDISSDLHTLSLCQLLVVCSGPKSLLDISATRELLESLGIPVIGYRTQRMPAFYVNQTECPTDYSVENEEQILEIFQHHCALQKPGAVLVVQGMPKRLGLTFQFLTPYLERAEQEADRHGIVGAARTPFVLDYLNTHTQGKTLRANLELLKRNAQLAARLAYALSTREQL